MSVGKITNYALPYNNVVAGGVATNNLEILRTIENIRLALDNGPGGNFDKADVGLIRLRANGKAVVEATGAELEAVMAYRGGVMDARFLDVPFADMTGATEFDRMVGAFDTTFGINSLTSEVPIQGNAASPKLKGIMRLSSAQKAILMGNEVAAPYAGVIAKLIRQPWNISTGGRIPLSIAYGPNQGAVVKRIHIFHTGHVIGCVVKQDSLVIHESTLAENEFEQKSHGRVPQQNVYTLDFVLDGNVRKALDTRDARSLEVIPEFDAADAGVVLVEYLDALGNL